MIKDYREFGNKGLIEPNWSCLIKKDEGLINYYDSVLNKPFNKKRFRRPGVFRNIGEVNGKSVFSDFKGIRCLDMPIKMAGNMEYKIPQEFSQFEDAINKMISFEHAHNKRIIDFYAYITIDQSEIKNKETHRRPGLHVDGFQGKRISPKVECDRSYIMFDCDCPSFWNQSFGTVEEMDDSTQNIFHEFDRRAHYSSEILCLPYNIYFMDCYSVHSANVAKHTKRTFLRLSFSVRQFDRLGNSHNNLFNYKWDMVERNINLQLNSNNSLNPKQ